MVNVLTHVWFGFSGLIFQENFWFAGTATAGFVSC